MRLILDFVNLKFLDTDKFIFFSNYESNKAIDFENNKKVSCLIYWHTINVQIRIKGVIEKCSSDYNNKYFETRDLKKNALAISSKQSKRISSFNKVQKNFEDVLQNKNLKECPSYWGGYKISPNYFEFWEGHPSRLNKRTEYSYINGIWKKALLQP